MGPPWGKPFGSSQNQLPQPTSSIPSYSRQAKNWLPPFQAIQDKPKPKTSIPSRSSQAKTDFFHSKPFQLGRNRFAPVQAIPFRTKPTFSIPSHYSQAKTNFRHSMLFQSGQNRLSPFLAIPVRAMLSINCSASPCLVAAGHRIMQFLFYLQFDIFAYFSWFFFYFVGRFFKRVEGTPFLADRLGAPLTLTYDPLCLVWSFPHGKSLNYFTVTKSTERCFDIHFPIIIFKRRKLLVRRNF
jgi:hypothetical protein